jgi:hypothetical protein
MTQLTHVFFSYKIGPTIFDYNKRQIQLTVIQLSGGHCTIITLSFPTHSYNTLVKGIILRITTLLKQALFLIHFHSEKTFF